MEKELDNNNAPVDKKLFQESLQTYLLQGADQIRQGMNRSHKSFQQMSRVFNGRGREHFIYEVLNEVEQIAMTLMRLNDSLSEFPGVPSDDVGKRIYRNSLVLTQRELSLHTRRSNELLVHLINFSTANSDEYYDHYLLYQELFQRKKKKNDHKTYYGCENQNNKTAIEAIKQYITFGESKVDLQKCWYLKGGIPKPNGLAELETFANCFKKALKKASVSERVALGFSYSQAYGEPSQSIHLGIGQIKSPISFEVLQTTTDLLFNVGMLCLIRCHKLLGLKRRKGIVPNFAKTYKEQSKQRREVYKNYVKPEIKKGDFVNVDDSLFEVVGVATGEFGYRSFKLKYLTEPHIPEITVEWYPAFNVRRVEDGTRMRDGIIELLTIGGKKPIIDPRFVRRAMRDTVKKLWIEYVEAVRKR